MISYYTFVILLCMLSLGILCILVKENARLTDSEKRTFYLTYGLIALSALSEWGGLQLNGLAELPKWPLLTVKCLDYILTPFAGGVFVRQMGIRNLWSRILIFVLAINTVFQVVAAFTGWMTHIDETNHYSHGPMYSWYIAVYILVIIIIVIEFVLFGKSFRKQNKFSLYSIAILVVIGILIQELFGSDFRTGYLAFTLGAILMFIHLSEFTQQASDDYIEAQKIRITTDALTGVSSRHAYSAALDELNQKEILSPDFVAFSIDINELKHVNDTLGHEAGDELICGAADCIQKVMGAGIPCYRTGGDEFVVLAEMPREMIEQKLSALEHELNHWSGEKVKELHLAVGYAVASDYDHISVEKLVSEADLAMYEAKTAYYKSIGKERRHH